MQRQVIGIVLALWCGGHAVAQQGAEVRGGEAPYYLSPFKSESMQLLLYGGSLDADDEAQLEGVSNTFSAGLGLSADLARYPHVGLDFELLYLHREFDTPIAGPFLGTIDNDTQLETLAMLLGGRLFYPAESPFRAYASGGLGYYKTDMRVSGSLMGFPGVYEDSDSSLQPWYGAGMRYNFDDWSLGLDYRNTRLDGSFGKFGIDNADIGGDSVMLGIGWRMK